MKTKSRDALDSLVETVERQRADNASHPERIRRSAVDSGAVSLVIATALVEISESLALIKHRGLNG